MDIARLRTIAQAARRKLLAAMPQEAACKQFIRDCRRRHLTGDPDFAELESLSWLYQFFIADEKNRAMGKTIGAKDIPAVTQLFTPGWIVRYLVENSLGRLWMLNHPGSALKNRMKYYIDAALPPEFQVIDSPEKLRFCDPCCGSGNMLLCAYDLLFEIYRERGYAESEIPQLIVNKNLYGMDIDPRAAELAIFALNTKAAGIPPNISVLNDPAGIGSLLKTENELKYHAVVTNPPYMGSRKMNAELKQYVHAHYPAGKADLSGAFIERCLDLLLPGGIAGMITAQSWMFLGSFADLRAKLLEQNTICTMLHLGPKGFDSIIGDVVQTTAFTVSNVPSTEHEGSYFRLVDAIGEAAKETAFLEQLRDNRVYRMPGSGFRNIPGSTVAYWVAPAVLASYRLGQPLKTTGDTRQGMATSDNDRFIRRWFEVRRGAKWFPYNKGGDYRKWYGNAEYVVNWENDGRELKEYAAALYKTPSRTLKSMSEYFKPAISWTKVTTSKLGMRYYPPGFIFDVAGCCIFAPDECELKYLLGLTNSTSAQCLLEAMSPTLNREAGHLAALPVVRCRETEVIELAERLVELARADWDSYETSWDFKQHPLMQWKHLPLVEGYRQLRTSWLERTLETKKLEEQLNRIFIDAYQLGDTLQPDVPWSEITLTCNPRYRYKAAPDDVLEQRLQLDTVKELISYGIGCILGRYAEPRSDILLLGDAELLFNDFLRTEFGEDHFKANLEFIENTLERNLRRYFLRHFYKDHVKMYYQRPIYWLFSSPDDGFNALIYMFDYRPEMITRLQAKYTAGGDYAELLRQKTGLTIDLDDGIEANYRKFGKLLKKI